SALRPRTCRNRFSLPGAGYQRSSTSSVPLVDGEAHFSPGVGEPQPRGPALLVELLIFDLPATPFERGRGLALHGLGQSLDRQAEAEHPLGERLGIRGAVFARLGSLQHHRVTLANDLRHALAGGGRDQHLVAVVRVTPGDVAGECIFTGSRRDTAGERKLERTCRRLELDLSARSEKRREQHNESHLRRRLIVFCSVSLSGPDLSDSSHTRRASSRSPSVQSTSPRCAPISASGRPPYARRSSRAAPLRSPSR